MLLQIYAIFIKELKILLRDPNGLVVLFALPLIFIAVMSSAQQSAFDVITGDEPVTVLVVNHDRGELAAEAIADLREADNLLLIEQMEGRRLTLARANELVAGGSYPLAVVFPSDFSLRVSQVALDGYRAGREEAQITFIADPAASLPLVAASSSSIESFVRRTVAYAQIPMQLQKGLLDGLAQLSVSQPVRVADDNKSGQQTALVKMLALIEEWPVEMPSADDKPGVRFKEEPPIGLTVEKRPNSVQQNVPAWTIFGMFFIIQTMAASLLREKQEGTFRRLLVAPLSRPVLLIGSLLPYYVVNLIQVGLMFAIGTAAFGLNLGSNPLALVMVSLATAAASLGLGLLVASLAKTTEQVNGLALLLITTLAAMGGIMVSRIFMPQFMQRLTHFTPHAWALDGYHDVIVRGLGVGEVLTETAVLVAFALIFFAFALWRFRFD